MTTAQRRNELTPIERTVAAQFALGNLPRLVSHIDGVRGPDGPASEQRWRVKSARVDEDYLVSVTADCNGLAVRCSCPAGAHGNNCWHKTNIEWCLAGELPYRNEARRAAAAVPSVALLCGRPEGRAS